MLAQQWVDMPKPNPFEMNSLKYLDLTVSTRNQLRQQWNQPVLWPIILILGVLLAIALILFLAYRKRERSMAKRGQL